MATAHRNDLDALRLPAPLRDLARQFLNFLGRGRDADADPDFDPDFDFDPGPDDGGYATADRTRVRAILHFLADQGITLLGRGERPMFGGDAIRRDHFVGDLAPIDLMIIEALDQLGPLPPKLEVDVKASRPILGSTPARPAPTAAPHRFVRLKGLLAATDPGRALANGPARLGTIRAATGRTAGLLAASPFGREALEELGITPDWRHVDAPAGTLAPDRRAALLSATAAGRGVLASARPT